MSNFNVPTREEVSENNQAILITLKKLWAFVLIFMPQWGILKMLWEAI
jgi:hypothetical protein